MSSFKVGYIYSENLRKQADKMVVKYRATMVQDLINSYKLLLENDNVKVVKSVDATESELLTFHSSDYISFIKNINENKVASDYENKLDMFGLQYDCPLLENMYDFISAIAGGSLTAAKLLVKGYTRTAINWFGGWHHAQRDKADGFCYVNDIVIAIEKLKQKFKKILYVDLDVHHGNGVEDAFSLSKHILTLSFHKVSAGFYPGSGLIDDISVGNGKYYSINVPLREGIGDKMYELVFHPVFDIVCEAFQPDCLVIQCGADILNGDPLGQCNVTLNSLGNCIKKIISCELPTIYLGGGGYNPANTARYWTYLTSLILNKEIGEDIPDDSLFFSKYEPSYELFISEGNRKDHNTEEYLNHLIEVIKRNCENLGPT